MSLRTSYPTLFLALVFTGCHAPQLPTKANEQVRIQQRTQADSQRSQLEMIPPASKNRYMTVSSFDAWENPYITVQANMLTLHVLVADANTSNFGAGGILRPVGARRQELNVSLDKLGDAVSAIPESSWPYGRVVAIEEAHKTPKAEEPTVRRTLESAVNTLSDLGVAVYDLNERKLQ